MATLAPFNSLIQGRVSQLPDEIQSKILLYACMHPCAKILREAIQPNPLELFEKVHAHLDRYIGNVYWIDYIHSIAYPYKWDCCTNCLFRYNLNPIIDTGSSCCCCCLRNYRKKPIYTNNLYKMISMKRRHQKNQNKALKKQQMRSQRTNNRLCKHKTNRSFK